jgi:outer membrane phospholipase A
MHNGMDPNDSNLKLLCQLALSVYMTVTAACRRNYYVAGTVMEVWRRRNEKHPTPWRRVLFEKLIVSELITKFSEFCKTRRFIYVLIGANHFRLAGSSFF